MNSKKLIIEEIIRMRSIMGLNENYTPSLLLETNVNPVKLIDGVITFIKGADAAKGSLIRGMDAETKEFFNSRLAEYGDELFGSGSAIKSVDDLVNASRAAELAAFSKKLSSQFDNLKTLIKNQGFDYSKYVYLPKFEPSVVTDKNIKSLIGQLPDASSLKTLITNAKNKDFTKIADSEILSWVERIKTIKQANKRNVNMVRYCDGILKDLENLARDKADWTKIEDAKIGDDLNNNTSTFRFLNTKGDDLEMKPDVNDPTGSTIIVTKLSDTPPTDTIYFKTDKEPLSLESVLIRYDENDKVVLYKKGEDFEPKSWKSDESNNVIFIKEDGTEVPTKIDATSVEEPGTSPWWKENKAEGDTDNPIRTDAENIAEEINDDMEVVENLTEFQQQKKYAETLTEDQLKVELKRIQELRKKTKIGKLTSVKDAALLEELFERGIIKEDDKYLLLNGYDKITWFQAFKGFLQQHKELKNILGVGGENRNSKLLKTKIADLQNLVGKVDKDGKPILTKQQELELNYYKTIEKGDDIEAYLKAKAAKDGVPFNSAIPEGSINKYFSYLGCKNLADFVAFMLKYVTPSPRYASTKALIIGWAFLILGISPTLIGVGFVYKGITLAGIWWNKLDKVTGVGSTILRQYVYEWSTNGDSVLEQSNGETKDLCPNTRPWCKVGIPSDVVYVVDEPNNIFAVPSGYTIVEGAYVYQFISNRIDDVGKNIFKAALGDQVKAINPTTLTTISEDIKVETNKIVGVEVFPIDQNKLVQTTKGELEDPKGKDLDLINKNLLSKLLEVFAGDLPADTRITNGKLISKSGDLEKYSFTMEIPQKNPTTGQVNYGQPDNKTVNYNTKTKKLEK